MNVRTRIAPSPTGIAHVGTMYTALINFAFAKSYGGKFILRIEDTDRERYIKGSEEIIYKSLKWLGIEYDEGPNIGGPFSPYTQSQRLDTYKRYAQKLLQLNKAYYCFCSQERLAAMRTAQQKMGKIPMYDGFCRKLAKSDAEKRAGKEKYVIRLSTPTKGMTSWTDMIRGKITFENNQIDDQVLLKSDGYPTYHLAVVVDDHLMEISHVIRAEEWISSTPKHILLYKAFGWKSPFFAHTPLLRNADRSKLSKRRNPVSVIWYKENGFLPEALVNYLCLMGWSHPQGKDIFSLREFIDNFSIKRIQTSQPIFDLEKLKWMNGIYIRKKNHQQLFNLLQPFLPKAAKPDTVRKIIPIVQERMHTLKEFHDYADFFFQEPETNTTLLLKQSAHSKLETKMKLNEFIELYKSIDEEKFNTKNLEQKSRKQQQIKKDSWTAKQTFMTLRVAITGKTVSPPLFETIAILEKQETLERLHHATKAL